MEKRGRRAFELAAKRRVRDEGALAFRQTGRCCLQRIHGFFVIHFLMRAWLLVGLACAQNSVLSQCTSKRDSNSFRNFPCQRPDLL